ncbi:PREDICTED: DNA repair protein REV1 isoform X3 [Nelumbo nucifera]|uniref:DNA repair protein REV1 n=1 Tax=Nelumbo nucifera TaxID=4432 RepID=A0A1U8QC09_NELNU|nr:PREDICTED: DNA repair protein REV1 isoform X3 [Nelumbo nucifera]
MSFDSSRSANSVGKSKRNLNSNSSNPSEGSNKNNKKKKINQKTLGMAWGANSLSSSRSFSRNSPFTDFGSYMVDKNRKLRNQFDADASTSSLSESGKAIFHGVSIFVDGFTVPSSQELRGYMLKHGGRFENYFSRHRVTHIICSNLPNSKLKNLRSFSGGLPVVKPTWVLDCVAANRLLNWVPYQLDQLVKETCNQKKLSAFFSLNGNFVSEGSETSASFHEKLETKDSLLNDCMIKNALLSEPEESINDTKQCIGESVLHEKSSEVVEEQPSSDDVKYGNLRLLGASSTDMEDENSVKLVSQSRPDSPSTSVNYYFLDSKNSEGSPNSRRKSPSNQLHSTLGDPNFVENYFKHSRLHFIGTWRNRYRKRFPSLPDGDKFGNPHNNALTVPRKIIHIDMDCFFVAVVIKNLPELRDKPVAVCHSNNPRGTAEISSANYPARDYGVRAGIFVRDAKALCPHLVIVPYDFEAYEEVADQFYSILHKHCNKVQAVSCDEAFLDVTDLEDEHPEQLASIIRKEIDETTGCTASAGIAQNLLIARLATRTAKPNGQCYIPPEKVDAYLSELPIKALPGVGHVLEEKLKKRQIWTCGQLRRVSKESLLKDFGTKTGDMLWSYCRGIDNRMVGMVQETKSIGAEVNWGVRFNDLKDEVSLRLQGCGVQGRTITLKLKKRRKDAEEPRKYMGCGDCENLSHSVTVPIPTDNEDVLQRISKQLFSSFHIDVKEIRGIGLQVSKLESADTGHDKNALISWLTNASTNTGEPHEDKEGVDRDCGKQSSDGKSHQFNNLNGPPCQMHTNQSSKACLNQVSSLPPLSHLDMGVIESLPSEIISEVNEMYGGKLIYLIEKGKGKVDRVSSSICSTSRVKVEGVKDKGKKPLFPHMVCQDGIPTEDKKSLNVEHLLLPFSDVEKPRQEMQSLPATTPGSSNLQLTNSCEDRIDFMPASLSQVDISVLQQLPEEIKVDILEVLPAHRTEYSSEATVGSTKEYQHDTGRVKKGDNHMGDLGFVSRNNICIGNPPEWVEKFKVSNCWILNIFVEMYCKSGQTGLLSSVLQSVISMPYLPLDASYENRDRAICCLCELLKQYIELNIESDIEEIHICFRLLKRLGTKSRFFLQVYDLVYPYLQELMAFLIWLLSVKTMGETCIFEIQRSSDIRLSCSLKRLVLFPNTGADAVSTAPSQLLVDLIMSLHLMDKRQRTCRGKSQVTLEHQWKFDLWGKHLIASIHYLYGRNEVTYPIHFCGEKAEPVKHMVGDLSASNLARWRMCNLLSVFAEYFNLQSTHDVRADEHISSGIAEPNADFIYTL